MSTREQLHTHSAELSSFQSNVALFMAPYSTSPVSLHSDMHRAEHHGTTVESREWCYMIETCNTETCMELHNELPFELVVTPLPLVTSTDVHLYRLPSCLGLDLSLHAGLLL